MGTKVEVFEETIKHKGFFEYSEFYVYCYDWLKTKGYSIKEKEYTEKVSGDSKEIIISWEAGKKATDYYKGIIKVKWHILGMSDTEAEVNGKRKKVNKGEVKIKVAAELERDYEGEWEKQPLWKFLRGTYDRYIAKTTQDYYADSVKGDAEGFVEDVKAFLTLEGRK